MLFTLTGFFLLHTLSLLRQNKKLLRIANYTTDHYLVIYIYQETILVWGLVSI